MADLSKYSDAELQAIAAGGGAPIAPGGTVSPPAALLAGMRGETPEPSFIDQLKRQLGLTVRAGVEGAASFPGLFISPFQRLAGAKTMDQGVSNVLTSLGVPKPETPTEEVVGAGARALASGGTSAVAARAIPAAVQAAPAIVNNLFAQKPVMQMAQAGVGAMASEGARQAGLGPGWQLAAGVAAPMVASSTVPILSAVARAPGELLRPVTRAGAEQVAADVLGGVTQDKTTAMRRLEEWQAAQQAGAPVTGVPGSRPTAGAVTGDYGVIGAEQQVARGSANPQFAERFGANNQARLDELAKLRATQDQIDAYIARRETATQGLRERAFAGATGPVDYQPVGQRILDLAATPAGGREESRKALSWLATRVGKYADEGRTDAANAYALHQDIGDLIAGKIKDSNGAALRLAGGLATEVKKTLAAQIETVAPGFARYLETYSRFSRPIDRLQVLVDKLGGGDLTKVTNALPVMGPEGQTFALSQAKLRNQTSAIENALPVPPRGAPLAPYQRDVLNRVGGDLNAETLALRGGKMPGSDTFQNMAASSFMDRVLGQNLAQSTVGRAVAGPLSVAYKPLEKRVNELVVQALLDPAKFAELLKIARTARASPTLTDVSQGAQRSLAAALLGAGPGQY